MIVQLDGVSEPVLRQAIMAGQAPTLARWLSDGTHQLRPWWATIPSTTPASTAALLYGEQQTIPAFRWWDRQTRGLLVANRPADAAVIEARLPAERGLPREGGIAVSTAFSGAAAQIYLVFSTALKRKALGRGDTFIPLFASPFLLPGVVLLTLGEMVKETYQSRRQRQRQVTPRIARKPTFVALRALTNVALRTVNLVVVVDQMSRGAPVIFVDFVDYDEIAHHAGPQRPEAIRAIEGMDEVLAELERVAAQVDTAYDLVVWSDHGQSLGTTFDQLTGETLTERFRTLMDEESVATLESAGGDDWGPLNAWIASTIGPSRRSADRLVLGPDRPDRAERAADSGEVADLVVVGGGNLGMAWFPEYDERPSLAEISNRWPHLVPGLALTPGVGLVMVGLGPEEAMLIGPRGTRLLGGARDGLVEGTDPMTGYDARGLVDLRRLNGMRTCGDIVLLSSVDPLGMVHAFEHQVGSHGGLGGPQNHAILIHPAALPVDDDLWPAGDEPLHGAVPIHAQIERWRHAHGTLSGSPARMAPVEDGESAS